MRDIVAVVLLALASVWSLCYIVWNAALSVREEAYALDGKLMVAIVAPTFDEAVTQALAAAERSERGNHDTGT